MMMMGTADEIVKAPEKGPIFMEDLPEEEQVVALVFFFNPLLLHMTCEFMACHFTYNLLIDVEN
jgi:ubiquitin carboxyl-terminal hydrolase 14